MSQLQQDGSTDYDDLAEADLSSRPVAPRPVASRPDEAFTARIASREDVYIATRISVADRPRAITLVNLSAHGFMGECPAGVPLRARVSLDLPGLGPWRGSVRWSVGRRVGGRFDTPLDAGQLAAALAPA